MTLFRTPLHTLYPFVMLACILFSTTACNNDVFIDGPLLDEDLYATVEGDGGEASFSIPVKDLRSASLETTIELAAYCTFYNAKGEEIDYNNAQSEVAKIVFDNDISSFELTRTKSGFTFRSLANPLWRSTWTIRLEFEYAVRFIKIEVLQGQPLQLVDVTYDPDLQIEETAKVRTNRFGINNDGSVSQTFAIFPYLNRLSSILVEPDKHFYWLRDMEVKMHVPVYLNGNWQWIEMPDIRLGHENDVQTSDDTIKVDVDVPAYAKVSVITDVTYGKAEARGNMTFLNVALDRRVTADFKVTSFCPTSYEIRVENAQ